MHSRAVVSVTRLEGGSRRVVSGTDRVITQEDGKGRPVLALALGEGKTFNFHRVRPPVLDSLRLNFTGITSFVVDAGTPGERTKQLFINPGHKALLGASIIVLVEEADVARLEGDCRVLECGEHALLVMNSGSVAECIDRITRNVFLVTHDEFASSKARIVHINAEAPSVS